MSEIVPAVSSQSTSEVSTGNSVDTSDPSSVDLKKATLSKWDINYIKLCRPNGIYLCYAILGFAYLIIPIIQTIKNQPIVYPNLPESVDWLIAGMFGIYTGAKTFEKSKGVA